MFKVNFSHYHNTYYRAYKYVSKQVEAPKHSESHLNLRDVRSPTTENAISARKRKSTAALGRKKDEKKGENIFTKRVQLACLAVQQRKQRKMALAQLIENKSDNAINDAFAAAKEFSQAKSIEKTFSKKLKLVIAVKSLKIYG